MLGTEGETQDVLCRYDRRGAMLSNGSINHFGYNLT
jgi:hypothetical protein